MVPATPMLLLTGSIPVGGGESKDRLESRGAV